jgi:hypothetical protein
MLLYNETQKVSRKIGKSRPVKVTDARKDKCQAMDPQAVRRSGAIGRRFHRRASSGLLIHSRFQDPNDGEDREPDQTPEEAFPGNKVREAGTNGIVK